MKSKTCSRRGCARIAAPPARGTEAGLAGGEHQHGDVADDLGDGRAARGVGHGALEARQVVAVAGPAGEALNQLDGDVGGVQVGEHQHVGAAGNLAVALDLLGGDLRVDGRVKLELDLLLELWAALKHQLERLGHLVDARAGAGTRPG